MKLLSRRWQVLPGWYWCTACPQRGPGSEADARQHAVVSGHETRHVRTAQVIFRLTPGQASPTGKQEQ